MEPGSTSALIWCGCAELFCDHSAVLLLTCIAHLGHGVTMAESTPGVMAPLKVHVRLLQFGLYVFGREVEADGGALGVTLTYLITALGESLHTVQLVIFGWPAVKAIPPRIAELTRCDEAAEIVLLVCMLQAPVWPRCWCCRGIPSLSAPRGQSSDCTLSVSCSSCRPD